MTDPLDNFSTARPMPSPAETADVCHSLPSITDVASLEDALSEPPDQVIHTMSELDGDILVLGAGGKMGPTLARMARRASDLAGRSRQVIGVSRFRDSACRAQLESQGIRTIVCDLHDSRALQELPAAANVIYMAGLKFGTSARTGEMWATNTNIPADVCTRFRHSRIAAFSTGNVYGFSPVDQPGSHENSPLNPVGEYAMSCLGRERIFEHYSRVHEIPVVLLRLNYACELRYGILVDIAEQVRDGIPINLEMGYFNVLWQADANAMALTALSHATSPPRVLNLAGTETVSVRQISEELGRLLGRSPQFHGKEAPDALLSDGRLGQRLLGSSERTASDIAQMVAGWIQQGQERWQKPTRYDIRSGQF